MHGTICYDDEGPREYGKANDVCPQCQVVETEDAKDRSSGYFDVEAIFMINQCQVFDFVDDECFEAVMKD